jgi:hypothetical protein
VEAVGSIAVCARMIPSEVKASIETIQPVRLEPQDIEILRAIRAAIPDADRMSAEQVLRHVLDAVRSFESKVILALPKPKD